MPCLARPRTVLFLTALLVVVLASLLASFPVVAQDPITRQEILEIAQAYVDHQWTPTAANIYHGCYAPPLCADTPNSTYPGGWWIPGTITRSVPYQWGGFSSLGGLDLIAEEDFDTQYRRGDPAGDINDAKLSEYSAASGVDCSGFVSRCWNLARHFNTNELLRQARPVRIADLKPGDMLDSPGHVMLFKEFLNDEKTSLRVYEASGWDWRVSERDYTIGTLLNDVSAYDAKTGTIVQKHLVGAGAYLSRGGSSRAYYAYTHFAPVDIMLVIDRSGSMSSGGKMAAAQNAAKMFVDLMRAGDKIGVVDFDDRVTVTYHLTEIGDDRAAIQQAKDAIDSLYARGSTSIGGGLQAGRNELMTVAPQDLTHVMLVLSDGLQNTSPMVEDVLPSVVLDKIVVYTIGLGGDADQQLLQNIATQTEGAYRYSPTATQLQEIYNLISAALYGQTVVSTSIGSVSAGGVNQHSVAVDSTVAQATFSLFWPGSDLDLELVQPDGSVIDASTPAADPLVEYVEGDTYEFFRVQAPQAGNWTMRVIGRSVSGVEDYVASVSGSDTMFFSAQTNQDAYRVTQPIGIQVGIRDDGGIDTPEPRPVLGASVTAEIVNPAQQSTSLALYDDGAHEDGAANDGTYGNTFADTTSEGTYTIRVRASGINNRDGQPFTRERTISVLVSGGVPFIWSSEAEQGTVDSPLAVAEDADASGCFYVMSSESSHKAPGVGAARYTFTVPRQETYYLWARVLARDWNRNSFFVSLDGGAPVIHEVLFSEAPWNNWAWDDIELYDAPVHGLPLQAGSHTLVFAGREAETGLDALMITNDGLYRPGKVLRKCTDPALDVHLPLILRP